jgi:hypothetical protein
MASRLVQYGVSASPGIRRRGGAVPVATTMAREAAKTRSSTPTRLGPTDPAGAPDEPPALALEALDREGVVPVVGGLLADAPRDRAPVRRRAVPAMPDTWVVSTSRFAARIIILLGTQP